VRSKKTKTKRHGLLPNIGKKKTVVFQEKTTEKDLDRCSRDRKKQCDMWSKLFELVSLVTLEQLWESKLISLQADNIEDKHVQQYVVSM